MELRFNETCIPRLSGLRALLRATGYQPFPADLFDQVLKGLDAFDQPGQFFDADLVFRGERPVSIFC